MYYYNKIANFISKLNFYKLIPYLMDKRGPLDRPHYHITGGLSWFKQQKRCYDVVLSRQEVGHAS